MLITLDGTFELANGYDRSVRILSEESWQWLQSTPDTLKLRAEWKTFFHTRATREINADFLITFPQAADEEAAFTLAHELSASMPTGGTMEITVGETTITFASFVPRSWQPQRIGVHVGLRVQLTAVDPDIAPEARMQFESGELMEFEDEP